MSAERSKSSPSRRAPPTLAEMKKNTKGSMANISKLSKSGSHKTFSIRQQGERRPAKGAVTDSEDEDQSSTIRIETAIDREQMQMRKAASPDLGTSLPNLAPAPKDVSQAQAKARTMPLLKKRAATASSSKTHEKPSVRKRELSSSAPNAGPAYASARNLEERRSRSPKRHLFQVDRPPEKIRSENKEPSAAHKVGINVTSGSSAIGVEKTIPRNEKPGVDPFVNRSNAGPAGSSRHENRSDSGESGAKGFTVADISTPIQPSDSTKVPMTYSCVSAVFHKYRDEAEEDHRYFVKSWLARARRCYEREEVQVPGSDGAGQKHVDRFTQAVSPFASMKPIQFSTAKKGQPNRPTQKLTQEVFAGGVSKGLRSHISVPVTKYRCHSVDVPSYSSYVSLKQSVLAKNERKLLYWPYMGDHADESVEEELKEELEERFTVLIHDRPIQLWQNEVCRKLTPYIESFLEDLGCTFKDVLLLFLDGNLNLDQSDIWVEGRLAFQFIRGRRDDIKINRDLEKWRDLVSQLQPSSDAAIGMAALASECFEAKVGFSLWHLAKRSSYVRDRLLKRREGGEPKENESPAAPFEYRSLACRVCHLHNCPFHGEVGNDPEAEEEDPYLKDSDSSTSSDSDREPMSTKRRRRISGIPKGHQNSEDAVKAPSAPQSRRGFHYWLSKSKTHLHHERGPFYPCNHEGTCKDNQCRCFGEEITCEKTCACASTCERRFRGCNCAQVGKVCWQNQRCDCFRLNRECDEDLCQSCGASQILDPVNRYNDNIRVGKCANVAIQRNVPKKMFVGQSEVHGFGLFIGESVKKHEYLGEYKGEILSRKEADRRGAIYAHLLTNYLFSLNREQELDSTRAGNKLRFINNSEVEGTINCYSKVMLCNTVTRIGMYANCDIEVGKELFFNYGYPKSVTQYFWEKDQKKEAAAMQSAQPASKVVTLKMKKEPEKPKGKSTKRKAYTNDETLARLSGSLQEADGTSTSARSRNSARSSVVADSVRQNRASSAGASSLLASVLADLAETEDPVEDTIAQLEESEEDDSDEDYELPDVSSEVEVEPEEAVPRERPRTRTRGGRSREPSKPT